MVRNAIAMPRKGVKRMAKKQLPFAWATVDCRSNGEILVVFCEKGRRGANRTDILAHGEFATAAYSDCQARRLVAKAFAAGILWAKKHPQSETCLDSGQ